MGFYTDRILPHLIHHAMRGRDFVPYRRRVLARAAGRVLEIGIGSGENLGYYGPGVTEILGLEPHPVLAAKARRLARESSVPVRIAESGAEQIPLDGGCIDTVVTTWTLCSIPDVALALQEMRRVLQPDGRMLFVEHGLAPDARVRRWQHRLTPVWKRVAGGCHLDRPIQALVEAAGFHIEDIGTGYMPGLRPMTFLYEGCARPGSAR